MSIKSIMLITSLFLIFSAQNDHIGAYPSPDSDVDDEIQAAQSTHDMAPLLDPDHTKSPLLVEAEQPSSKKLFMRVQERVLEALENQDITGLVAPSLISESLVNEYDILKLANRIGFSLVGTENILKLRNTLKESSFIEKVEKALDKIEPFYQAYFWNETLD